MRTSKAIAMTRRIEGLIAVFADDYGNTVYVMNEDNKYEIDKDGPGAFFPTTLYWTEHTIRNFPRNSRKIAQALSKDGFRFVEHIKYWRSHITGNTYYEEYRR